VNCGIEDSTKEIAVSRKSPAEEPVTLSDADIGSERAVTRRSLLGVLGIGAGVAAGALLGSTTSAPAADSDAAKKPAPKKAAPKKPPAKKAPAKKKEETDND
jgi:hypothetical protein